MRSVHLELLAGTPHALIRGALRFTESEAQALVDGFKDDVEFDVAYETFKFPVAKLKQVRAWIELNVANCTVHAPWPSLVHHVQHAPTIDSVPPADVDLLKTQVSAALVDALYPFQRDGVACMLTKKRVLLADEMGLGKTLQALAVADSKSLTNYTLVICPPAVVDPWLTSAQKWMRYGDCVARVQDLKPPDEKSSLKKKQAHQEFEAKFASKPHLVVATYGELMQPEWMALAKKHTWSTVICDEAHAFCSHDSQRTKALALDPQSFVQLAETLVLITGTPQLARAAQLFALVHVLFPEVFVGAQREDWEVFV